MTMQRRCLSILAIVGGILLAFGRGEARQAVTSNLAAYWPMDTFASNSTPDASGNGHTATQATVASQPTTTPGMFTGALNFDNTDDYLSVADSAGINVGTGSFTVAAWVKPSGTTQDRVINKWNGSIGWLMDINTGSGGAASPGFLRLKMNDGTNNIDYFVSASLAVGAWTHVAATVDRTAKELKLYANGVQIGTTQNITALTGTLTNAAALGIGTIPSSLGNYCGGALDEVRLYTAALTQPQVMTLVAPLPPTALNATLTGVAGDTATLTWTTSDGSMSYNVYRSLTSGTGYSVIASGLTAATYDDVGVPFNTTYYYVVRGFNVVESADSNEAFVTLGPPPPPPPRGASSDDNHPCGVGAGGSPGGLALGAALLTLAALLAGSRRAP